MIGYVFLTNLGVTRILCIFLLVLEGKAGKAIHKSWGLEFLEKFPGNNFALSKAEDSTSGPISREDIVDVLLMRKLLAICQKPRKSRCWELIEFITISRFSSFKDPFALIINLFELYFIIQKMYCVVTS